MDGMAAFDLLFFDLDGTLLLDDHATVSPRTIRALEEASRAGVRLSIATGRCLGLISEQVRKLPFDYAVTSNGAAVYDLKAGTQLYHHAFSPEEAMTACRIIDQHVDFFELFVNGEILLTEKAHAMTATRPLPPWHQRYFWRATLPPIASLAEYLRAGAQGLEKINLVSCDPEDVARIQQELEPLGLYEITSSIGRGALEVVPRGCSKGAAIRWLCSRLEIDLQRTAAFGDGGNDMEMLTTVGCGVAMGNAGEALCRAADAVTATNMEDGIALFIEQHVFA